MSGTTRGMRLALGTSVRAAEGELGVLADLVIDPRARRVTHLVVEPRHHPALARLVPIEFARHGNGDAASLTLRCSAREFMRFPEVHELAYDRMGGFPVEDPEWQIGVRDVLVLAGSGTPGSVLEPGAELAPPTALSYDRIPRGEVEVRRKSPVLAADGSRVGRVAGLVAEEDDHIAELVVRRRWPRRPRELRIPADAVAQLETDAVTLGVTRRELEGRA